MGILDSLASGLMGSSGLTPDKAGPFIKEAIGTVAKMGLPKLIELFEKAGLKDQVMSWIGTGANKSVSGDQVQSALGPKILEELAKKTGIDAGTAASALAQYLPKVIDAITPDGKADGTEKHVAALNLADMGSLIGKFLK